MKEKINLNNNSSKKGQAALEFLTTYGWAFLIIIVVLGGLSYLGVFNPSNFVSSSCQLDEGIACPVFSLYNDSTGFVLDMGLQNNMADKLTITKLILESSDGSVSCVADTPELISGSGPVILSSYGDFQERDVKFKLENNGGGSCDLDAESNSKQKFDMKLYYIKGTATLPSVTSGKLITVVEQH